MKRPELALQQQGSQPDLTMNYDELNEQQRAASQAMAEIVADLGVGFALQSLGQTCAQIAQSEDDERAEALSQAAGILHQLADLLGEENE